MLNPAGCVDVPLTVFAGDNLELDPTDIPTGLSWGCRNVAFQPGQVFTRPSLQRVTTYPRGGTTQCVYTHDYVRPNGQVSRMDCYSDGAIFCDGVQIGQTQAGNRFHMASAFGKVFIAISDGVHGVDVPLQWDGQYLDRVSQDGPGDTCTLANYLIPATSLIAGSTATAVPITNAVPIDSQTVQVGGGDPYGGEPYPGGGGYNPPVYETYYTELQITTSSAHGLVVSESVTISGNTLYNLLGYVNSVIDAYNFTVGYTTQSSAAGTGGTVTPSAPFLQRSGNEVSAATATAHQLRPGYKVSITGVSDQNVGGSVTQIVIDNTAHPGLAHIFTSSPHGLSPEETVTLSGVANVAVGGGVNSIVHNNGIATLTTNAAHFMQVGAYILVQSSGGPALPFTVSSVASSNVFTYTDGIASGTQAGGAVTLVWPGNQNTSQVFTVDSVDSPNSFFVPLSYSNGTWTSGTLTYPWNGEFYVTSVPTATTLTYLQLGPDAILTSGSGTLTPTGQIAPGQRSAVVSFQLRDGTVTKPSVKVSISTNGGKYLFVTNLPIGPPNTVARIVSLPGADGGSYFYIPIAPRDPTGTYLIGTSTVVPDNTTASAIFDFSDDALFDGEAIDIPGNNLFGLEVIGPCLGFFAYASRLLAWGDRSRIQQFRNMGFEGGMYAGSVNSPLGWNVIQAGTLVPGDYGMGWKINGSGTGADGKLGQTAYIDSFGVPILKPNTQYTFRLWLQGSGQAVGQFYSPTQGLLANAVVNATSAGGWAQADFSAATPAVIPSDTLLLIYGAVALGQTLTIDEMEVVYTKSPYLLTARASYVNNPSSFHGVTGRLGIADFPLPITAMDRRRGSLCLLTAGPKGGLYETNDSEAGEPVTWTVEQRGALCGVDSVWGAAQFEDWFCWASDTGLRIYDGAGVEKLSQEVQSWWNTINPAAKQFVVVANDPYIRRLYIAAPTGTATVANAMYVMDYRELNTAGLLTSAGTLRVGYSGKMVTTDLTRKWSPWTMTINYMAMVSQPTGDAKMYFCGGTGGMLSDAGSASLYTLNEGAITGIDADYGPFWQNCQYPTYFFVSADEAQGLKLGAHRLFHSFATMNASGIGTLYVQAAVDRTDNIKRTTRALTLATDLARDLEFGLDVSGERVSYIIRCQPSGAQPAPSSAPAGFRVSSLTVSLKDQPFSPIRGLNG